jgi:hypothetical protein
MVRQIADVLYPLLIVDEPDPETQAANRAKVSETARAAWLHFRQQV